MSRTSDAISIIADTGTRIRLDPIRLAGRLTVSVLGLTLARLNLDLTITSASPTATSDGVRASEADSDLSSMSRAELYRLAQDARVAGRSSMSHRELALALAHRSEPIDR